MVIDSKGNMFEERRKKERNKSTINERKNIN